MKVENASYEAYLAAAMNEGAAERGLPTVEDLDSLVSRLHGTLSENWENYFSIEKEE